MSHEIRVDGSAICFETDEQDTLLRAALRNGVPLPYECNSGGCGSCKFELIDGEVVDLWPGAHGLSARDRGKGKRLACQCRAKSDVVIKLRLGDYELPEVPPARLKLRYLGRRDLTADMAELRFQSDHPAHFLPGQYAMLMIPGIEGERAYSMSNIPNEAGYWQFIIKHMPGGKGSGWLFDELHHGDVLDVDGPYGQAYLRPEIDRDIVCIAGGSGLSPVMSIVRAVTGDPAFTGRKIYLFFGGRTPGDICTPALLSEIEPLNAQLICETAISDEDASTPKTWRGPCCYIHELVVQKLDKRLADFEYYFCGPPAMSDAVQRMLMIDHKVPFRQLHFDRFF